jgi:hypothetical protein
MAIRLWGAADPLSDCRVVAEAGRVTLRSPRFSFVIESDHGLHARTWRNERTGDSLDLGAGSELEVTLGPPEARKELPGWRVTDLQKREGATGEAVFHLECQTLPLSATVTYRWTANDPVLHKFVKLANGAAQELPLLDVCLGSYHTAVPLEEREQGFPVYLDGQFFLALAHPAGWVTGKEGRVRLTQHPGTKLAPGGGFTCMEAVYGAALTTGGARTAFVEHIRSRMRRVLRGHDHPYVIFDNFGSWPEGENHEFFVQNTEAHELYSLDRLAASQAATGCRFDLCNLHFWVDHAGDLQRFDPRRFPQGLLPIKRRLDGLGVSPGLWIDSSMASWSIGRNPRVEPSLTEDRGWFCRASEPIKSMYLEAFRYHLRQNGVRLLKFDNLRTECNNPAHGHLPGVYSTEAIENAVITFLDALDAECPDVFLILYWGHRSPWWLLHGDTLFDSGIGIEAASPATQPAPHARDSVTQKLDQAQEHARDLPPLGKDSLGVWLSDWGWNSSIGKERWQEGLIMDMCRGSLLIQLWADREWLSPPEWRQLADFVALMRERPECFGHPQWILGSPAKDEAYGYACSDGHRAFFAIHNATWKDQAISLRLGPSWGLPVGQHWHLYRWYPNPARLEGGSQDFGELTSLALRPFAVVLIEAVPAGEPPSLGRTFEKRPIPTGFSEASQSLDVEATLGPEPQPATGKQRWTVLTPSAAVSSGGATLSVQSDHSILATGTNPAPDTYTITAETALEKITGIRLEALPDPALPSGGPGRAFNGNFALAEFTVTAAPKGNPSAKTGVPLAHALSDFAQTSHGGWPVAAAIDGHTETAWSIYPQANCVHTALFETQPPVGFAGGTVLTFTLLQGYVNRSPEHTLGKLCLAVTTDPPPLEQPAATGPRPWLVSLRTPPTRNGGEIIVAAEFKRQTERLAFSDIGDNFTAEATLEGTRVVCHPVLGKKTYPSSWQAWRVTIDKSDQPRTLVMSITSGLPPEVKLAFTAHFLPR